MTAITKNYKNGYQGSAIQDKTCNQRPNTTKYLSTFNLNMLSAVLDVSHYKEL